MIKKRPLYDDYWEAKRFPIENIDNIPMYLLASYSSVSEVSSSLANADDWQLHVAHPRIIWNIPGSKDQDEMVASPSLPGVSVHHTPTHVTDRSG